MTINSMTYYSDNRKRLLDKANKRYRSKMHVKKMRFIQNLHIRDGRVITKKVLDKKVSDGRMSNHYLTNDKLTFETIICRGKGKITKDMSNYFILLIDKYLPKFGVTDVYLLDDIRQNCYIDVVGSINKLDLNRNAFTYYTQVIKNSGYQMINQWFYIKPTNTNYKRLRPYSYDKAFGEGSNSFRDFF